MRVLLIIGAVLSFLGLVNLPIGYYTFLRIYLTLISVSVVYKEFEKNESISNWIILFGVIAILFNPVLPVYLNNKSVWAIIDIITGLIFAVAAYKLNFKSSDVNQCKVSNR